MYCIGLSTNKNLLSYIYNVPKSTNPANWNYGRFGLAEKTNDECMA